MKITVIGPGAMGLLFGGKLAACADVSLIGSNAANLEKINKEMKGKGRILLRESGTEPVVRIMLESDDKELNQKYIDTIKAMIKKGGYIGE